LAILPNGDRATVDIDKLVAYFLNFNHPKGKHKAILWKSMLGVEQIHAEWLRRRLLETAKSEDCVPTTLDEHGQRYEIRFQLTGMNGQTKEVIAAWIIGKDEINPRLVTSYPETRQKA
jgi:hypothetical protein